MINSKDLVPLPKGLIKVGLPTIHPLYDEYGKLLLQAGMVVETEAQMGRLYEHGRYKFLQLSENALAAKGSGGQGVVEHDGRQVGDNQQQGERLVVLPFNRLKLGENLQISPLSDNAGSIKYFIKFVGGVDKKSLIFTLPLIDNKVMFVKENTGFSVFMFSGKGVYRFNTMVDVVVSRPFPHMYLKFPREVYFNALRRNQRVPVNIIVALMNKSANEHANAKISGRIVDLSLGGILVETNKTNANADVGDDFECTFKINFGGEELVLVLDSILKNLSPVEQSDGRTFYSYGIQFKHISVKDKVLLQGFIFQLLTGENIDEL